MRTGQRLSVRRTAGRARVATMRAMRRPLPLVFALAWLSSGAAHADDRYRPAPGAIGEVLRAPASPTIKISPDGRYALFMRPQLYPPIADLAAPMLRAAGVRINPDNNGLHAWPHYQGGIAIKQLPDGKDIAIRMPADLAFTDPVWNADATAFAFLAIGKTAINLWLVDVKAAQARLVSGVAINPVLEAGIVSGNALNRSPGQAVQWMPDGRSLLVKAVPVGRRPAPADGPPGGPIVEDATGTTRASSTYEARDLLRTPHDADLFEYYATSQLAVVDARTLGVRRFGPAGVVSEARIAPGGKYVLVSRLERPYSFSRPWGRFAHDVEVWSLDGSVVESVAHLALADQVPIDGEPVGPRDVAFVPTLPATLFWVEALDEGDWAVKAAHRDRLVLKEVGKPIATWFDLEQRFRSIDWIDDGATALVTEWQRDRRWLRTFVARLAERSGGLRTLWDRSEHDIYGAPGQPRRHLLPSNRVAVQSDGTAIWLTGEGSSPAGDRPFLDRLDLATLRTERVFRADRSSLERVEHVYPAGKRSFLTVKESPSDPPNLALRTLGAAVAAPAAGEAGTVSDVKMLTAFPDPTPQIRGVAKQVVTTRRADGTQVSFTLYLPPGHRPGTRLPTVFWAYPREFSDPTTAGQVAAQPSAFTQPRGASPVLYALAGYAVLEVSMPVVGPLETVYDSFVEQIVANARAAIDKAVALGVTDPERVGVSGHSHGALMTANLLAYSNLFRAGVARSGAYNHTLRPFGFQTEHRTFYKARDTYLKLSPLINAEKIDEPLLLIHGQLDVNPGTVPLQSEKLFEAIRGLGGTTRLVMLPFESHGYAALESIETVMAESVDWFDRYVKNAPARKAVTVR
jgi:dipeptidyl aminopeptidase/acylaminoacyl peptidase